MSTPMLTCYLYEYAVTPNVGESLQTPNTITYTAVASTGNVDDNPDYSSTVTAALSANGAPADNANGQYAEFSDDTNLHAAEVKAAVTAGNVGTSHNFGGTGIQIMQFMPPPESQVPDPGTNYNSSINIWDSTGDTYVKWASFTTTHGTNTSYVLSGLDTATPTITTRLFKAGIPIETKNFDTAPTTSLPEQFVIELANGEGAVDYVFLTAVGNCLAGDTLIEKMVEKS